jgi:hypothetical protein
MFLKFDLYRVWYSIFFFKTCWLHSFFKSLSCMVFFVWRKWDVVVGKETSNYLQAFHKSHRLSLTSPVCQLRERSCHKCLLNLESKEWILLSDWLTQITVLNIERENQGTAIKGKLTTSEDSDKITTQNRKRL